MGFLSKLFGGGNGESGMESAPAPLAGETGMPILRTAVRGGYDKRETLMMFDQLTTEKIMHGLSAPFERCRYCTEPTDVPWHVIHEPSVLEDWV